MTMLPAKAMHRILLAAALAVSGGTLVGCSSEEDTGAGNDEAQSAAAEQEARQIFATRCVPCHGESGQGDGAASASLNPRPRDFTDAEWQSSVDDAHIERIIQYGGAAVGKSPAMPANPDLQSKPEVVEALRAYIRGLGD